MSDFHFVCSKTEDQLINNRLCLFSYGSGLQASLYSIRIQKAGDQLTKLLSGIRDVKQRLDSRKKVDPAMFAKIMALRQEVHHKAPYEPVESVAEFFDGTYYLVSADDMHRRKYARKTKIANSH